MVPFFPRVPDAISQQDYARPHTARISQHVLNETSVLSWPVVSPDLSSIEHVGDLIRRRLRALPQKRSEDELWLMVDKEWAANLQGTIHMLIESVPRRVAACLAARDALEAGDLSKSLYSYAQVRSASVSMELPLVNVSTCELRSVIRFFTAKNETAVNIHRNLVSVYGEGCMSIQMVRRWRSWFLEGRQNVHDDERSDRPVTATDNAAVAAVRNVVEANRRVAIDEIMIRLPPGIEIGCSSIGTIMSDV
ncbi:hypothetical protein LAZ67_2001441 [Cordylochernes scorpioides]|uniref:Mos1 transposase HTH domain-containing protein n=1 Tax=Cordylochernes scorpioides TaxID=51811 RepID=A0ABY6K1H2_9ARAC|nr:hypothetical protein LAZ67_2001441 [Cordylochernes scorpioides]